MPYKPSKPCIYPLCADLVEAGSRYCNKHKGKLAEPKRYHDGRYRRGWPALRAAYLRRYPLCAECKSYGIIKLASEVDHIIPIEVDLTKRLEWNNLQSMCKSCHSRKTASEQSRTAVVKEQKEI